MSDLISRQAAIKAIGDAHFKNYGNAIMILQEIPSAEPERTAKVVEHDASVTDTDGYKYHRSEYLCGACKKKVLGGDEYCSHCGCRLDWNEDIPMEYFESEVIMSDEPKLKPCPFCGNLPQTRVEIASMGGGSDRIDFSIVCDMQDEAQRFADYIDKQGLTEDEMTVEKMQELMEKFKNEDAR